MARQASALLLIRSHFSEAEERESTGEADMGTGASFVTISVFKYSNTLCKYTLFSEGSKDWEGTSFRLGFLPCPPSLVDNRMDLEMKKKICV